MALSLRALCTLLRTSSFARTSMQLQSVWGTSVSASRLTSKHQRTFNRSVRLEIKTSAPDVTWKCRGTSKCPIRIYSSSATSYNPTTPSSTYTPPTTGIISHLPPTWVPYAELIRLDKPTGTYLLFFPCLFSTLLAAPLTTPITPPSVVLSTSALFFSGALIMRGAGCTINDLWDRNLDPHVARTRLRPIARGALSVHNAIPFLGFQLLVGLGVLVCFPSQCLYYAVPSLLLVGTYPLAKRVTNYPQFVLGLTFSWGAMMGFPALGVDLLSNTHALISAACLYTSCVAWTIVYDMIYAYQDIRDDAAAGIKSIALAQESNAKTFLAAVAALQVALLTGAGLATSAGPVFFVGTCGGAAATLGYMIWKVDLRNVEDCWRWFREGALLIGGTISLGLLGEYFVQLLAREKLEEEDVVVNGSYTSRS